MMKLRLPLCNHSWFEGILVFTALLVGVAGLRSAHRWQNPWKPVLQPDAVEHSFGIVPPGETLTRTFLVRNEGLRRIVLNERACCGVPAAPPVIIAPGETKPIPVELPTAGRYGRVEHRLELTTSDRAQPKLTFAVWAWVREPSGT